MMDKLLKVLEVIEKSPSIIVVALMIYAYHWYTTDTPKVVKTDGVTINTVTQDLNINGDIRDKAETYEEIEKAREGKVKPSVTLPPDAGEETVARAVDELNGDIAVSEPTEKSSGTNVYSITIRRAPHGVGIYGDVTARNGNMDFGYGLHYRNKRWVYQIGVDQDRDFNGRIAYELVQW